MAQQRGRRSGGSPGAAARDARTGGPTARPAASAAAAQHREHVRRVVEPVVAAAGYDLEDLTVSRVGRRHLLRIAVDSDHGVDLDAVAELSRSISTALDEVEAAGDELIAGEYELEVGSPGVDRPLTEPRHWRRNVRRLVKVRVGEHEITGRVTAADDSGATLDVDGAPRTVPYGQLGPGKVQVELKRLADLPDEPEDDDPNDDFHDDEEGEDEA